MAWMEQVLFVEVFKQSKFLDKRLKLFTVGANPIVK